jgi:hypothetical protein
MDEEEKEKFLSAINDDWIKQIILQKSKHPVEYIFTHLLCYVSGNILVSTAPVFTEDRALEKLIIDFKDKFGWTAEEVREAYILAHGKILQLALRN